MNNPPKNQDIYPEYLANNVHIDISAKIGENNIIHPFVYIGPNVEIGNNNIIYPFTSIGTPGEHKTAKPLGGRTIIGDNNVIREHVTIQAPIGTLTTIIRHSCYIMNKCHIAHDCIVEDECVMSTGSIIGGYTILEKYANLGLGSVARQRLIIGESAMVGMNSTVTKNVLPFSTVTGTPAKIKQFNAVGAQKRGFTDEQIKDIIKNYSVIVNSDSYDGDGYIERSIKEFKQHTKNFAL